MTGPRLIVAAIVAALALPPGASAADLVIKLRSKHVSSLGGFRASGSHGTLRNAIKAWGKPSTRTSGGGGFYDAFVQGDAPIVTAQMKGGAVDFIRADVNPPK